MLHRRILATVFAVSFSIGIGCGGKAASVDAPDSTTSSSSGSTGASSSGGASGSSSSSGSDDSADAGCSGTLDPYCGADGRIASRCCPAGAHCSPVETYCNLGGGKCALGSCDADAGGGPTTCGTMTCKGGDVCVITQSGGGACMLPEDGGLCPDGQPPEGACCNRTTTTYECKPLPSSCNGKLACPCAESLCTCGGCQLAQAPNTLSCGCFYP